MNPSGECMGPREFATAANVSRETLDRFRLYADRLVAWHASLNLVAASTLPDLWRRHILDSFQLAAFIPRGTPRPAVTDLGSGAGFPGLVLAIATGHPVTLVEADTRKCAFLGEVARQTDAPVSILNLRIEALCSRVPSTPVDILTARALAPLPALCGFAAALRPASCLFPKGRKWRDELADARKRWTMRVEAFESATSGDGRILRLSSVEPAGSAASSR